MRESSDEVIIMTDDGSYGRKGLVTEGVEEVIKTRKSKQMLRHRSRHHDEICLPAD